MQDVHPIVHRRRHLHHQTASPPPALKCPRCDSPNTKFCYYNNYNLSQPRHFCKNCRRYWTNGGVLRNVPVGGGSRKSKRSKPKPKPSLSSSSADSTTVLAPAAVEEDVLPPEIGGFMSSSGSDPNSEPDLLGFIGEVFRTEEKMQGLGGGMLDPTVRIEENRGSNGGVVALDCELGDHDQNVLGLFDLDLPDPSVDNHQAYWTHSTTSFQHWSDHNINNSNDNNNNNNHDYLSLFLP